MIMKPSLPRLCFRKGSPAGLWSCACKCAESTFDAFSAAISLADIAADVAVTIEFAQRGRFGFFIASSLVFTLAQASYAFMFVTRFGSHLSNLKQTLVFLIVLPFSQLVPLFTLLEAQTTLFVGCLESLGLKPTTTQSTDASNTDSLWTLLNLKLRAHAGFVLEALVEAIPQCMLQIVAVVTSQELTPLTMLSILLSLSVICSKGWLASYSIHRPTFVFNSIAIAADAACLIAATSWMAHSFWGPHADARGSDQATVLLTKVVLALFSTAFCLGVSGGFGATLFSIADDHLKARDAAHPISFASIPFNLYFVRLITWSLSLLPCATLLCLTRFSLLPLVAFQSLGTEHALHHDFFSSLFDFLLGRRLPQPSEDSADVSSTNSESTQDERISIANVVLALASDHAPSLLSRLAAAERGSTAKLSAAAQRRIVGAWVRRLGCDLPSDIEQSARVSEPSRGSQAGGHVSTRSEPQIPSTSALVQMRRPQLRWLVFSTASRCRLQWLLEELLHRSEVFRRLLRSSLLHPSESPPQTQRPPTVTDFLLLVTALMALLLTCISGLLALPVLLLFVPLSACYPILALALSLPEFHSDTFPDFTLPLTLTAVYTTLLAFMLLLVPSVRKFQSVRAAILTVHGLPDAFFCPEVPLEMHRRLRVARRISFNTTCSVCCEHIRATDTVTVLERCSHAFHKDCLAEWLRGHPTCPNCRQEALPHELTMVPFFLSLPLPCMTGSASVGL